MTTTDLRTDTASATTSPRAVVTGASTGIGRALAAELAEHGYDVVIAADEATSYEAATDLRRHATHVVPVELDLGTPEGVERLYAKACEYGPVGVAVLNVGIGVSGRFDQTDLADDLRLVDVNVRSTVHLVARDGYDALTAPIMARMTKPQ